MAEKEFELDDKAVEVISKRVRESMDLDAQELAKQIRRDMTDDVRDRLAALQDHEDAVNVRIMNFERALKDQGEVIKSLAARVAPEELEAPPEEEEKPKEEPPEETLDDVVAVCTHSGKGQRLGFTKADRDAGTKFCPECGSRIQWT